MALSTAVAIAGTVLAAGDASPALIALACAFFVAVVVYLMTRKLHGAIGLAFLVGIFAFVGAAVLDQEPASEEPVGGEPPLELMTDTPAGLRPRFLEFGFAHVWVVSDDGDVRRIKSGGRARRVGAVRGTPTDLERCGQWMFVVTANGRLHQFDGRTGRHVLEYPFGDQGDEAQCVGDQLWLNEPGVPDLVRVDVDDPRHARRVGLDAEVDVLGSIGDAVAAADSRAGLASLFDSTTWGTLDETELRDGLKELDSDGEALWAFHDDPPCATRVFPETASTALGNKPTAFDAAGGQMVVVDSLEPSVRLFDSATGHPIGRPVSLPADSRPIEVVLDVPAQKVHVLDREGEQVLTYNVAEHRAGSPRGNSQRQSACSR